jgi:peroxiredoxin-like protein
MQAFPHHYAVTARVDSAPDIMLQSAGLAPLRTSLPAEFGGIGDQWSPETLLVAAVADCFALTFRGLAARSNLTWTSLSLEVVGTLDRVDGVTRFVEFRVIAGLRVPAGTSESHAARLLEKAETTCLITRSLSGVTHLDARVESEETP